MQQHDDIYLNYGIKSQKERADYVEHLVETLPKHKLTNKNLEKMADYIIAAMPKEERRQKRILTPNRLVTVNRRETSLQGTAEKLEVGEDGIYGMLSDMGKSVLLTPKIEITEDDLATIPSLRELREEIEAVAAAEKKARGHDKYVLKKQLIQMRQQQYVLKDDFKKPKRGSKKLLAGTESLSFDEKIIFNENMEPVSDGLITLFNPYHVSALLCNYSYIKQSVYGKFDSDLWYIIEELDEIAQEALYQKDILMDLLIYKVDGKSNAEIQKLLENTYGIVHSIEYLSCLWRNKIPRLIADRARERYLLWYFTFEEKGKWKKCSKCGKVKLAHSRYFSQNLTSKDGFYSICKQCRNTKEEEEIDGNIQTNSRTD